MTHATQAAFAKDSWQTPRNARTLRAYMALRNQEIGARLRELRGERPQTVIAEELGVAQRTYQNWEAGDAKPAYRNLQRLADYYGVGEDFILTGERMSGAAPDPFAGHDRQAELLARVEELLLKQNALLDRQSQILARIETAITRESEAAKQLAAVDDAFVQRVAQLAAEAIPPEPETPARARKRHATSRSPQA